MEHIENELNYFLYNSEDERLKNLCTEILTKYSFHQTNNIKKIIVHYGGIKKNGLV